MFLHFMQKFKMATKSGGKTMFGKSTVYLYPVVQKFCQNRSISLRFQDKRVFAFYAKIQDDCQNIHYLTSFILVSLRFRDKLVLRLMQKFKMAAKSGGKTIFAKSCQYTLQIPCGSKISSNSLYLAPFLR